MSCAWRWLNTCVISVDLDWWRIEKNMCPRHFVTSSIDGGRRGEKDAFRRCYVLDKFIGKTKVADDEPSLCYDHSNATYAQKSVRQSIWDLQSNWRSSKNNNQNKICWASANKRRANRLKPLIDACTSNSACWLPQSNRCVVFLLSLHLQHSFSCLSLSPQRFISSEKYPKMKVRVKRENTWR